VLAFYESAQGRLPINLREFLGDPLPSGT